MKSLPDEIILGALRCPVCKKFMRLQGDIGLFCEGERRHCYDLASSGYVNLMPPGQASGGDAKKAVRARSAFLNLKYYQPVAEELSNVLTQYVPSSRGLLIDAGCGEGYYTVQLAELGFSVFGADLSKFAVDAAAKRAARSAPNRSFFSVSSVFELPIADGSARALVNVFAPCAEREFSRVLCQNGILAVVYAGPDHLMGLKRAIYDQTKSNEGRADLPKDMDLIEERRVRFDVTVEGTENLKSLFAMTPYYWKTSPRDSAKLEALDRLDTPVDMIIAVYRKKHDDNGHFVNKEIL